MDERGLAARLKALDGYHYVRWLDDCRVEKSMYVFGKKVKQWRLERQ